MERRVEEGESVRSSVRNKGGVAEFISCDVSRPRDIAETVRKTITLYGGVNTSSNNAGIGGPETFPYETQAQWDYVIEVNLNGVFEMCNRIWPIMVKGGGGTIVNMSLGAVVTGFSPFLKRTQAVSLQPGIL